MRGAPFRRACSRPYTCPRNCSSVLDGLDLPSVSGEQCAGLLPAAAVTRSTEETDSSCLAIRPFSPGDPDERGRQLDARRGEPRDLPAREAVAERQTDPRPPVRPRFYEGPQYIISFSVSRVTCRLLTAL